MNPLAQYWLYVVAAALVLVVLLLNVPVAREPATDIAYSEFKEFVASGQVEEVTLRGSEATATLTEPLPAGAAERRPSWSAPAFPPSAIRTSCICSRRKGWRSAPSPKSRAALRVLLYFALPWLILIGLYWLVWRRMWQSMAGGFGGRSVDTFLSGPA